MAAAFGFAGGAGVATGTAGAAEGGSDTGGSAATVGGGEAFGSGAIVEDAAAATTGAGFLLMRSIAEAPPPSTRIARRTSAT